MVGERWSGFSPVMFVVGWAESDLFGIRREDGQTLLSGQRR